MQVSDAYMGGKRDDDIQIWLNEMRMVGYVI